MSYVLGAHEATPQSYQFGTSAKKGTEMVSVVFQFASGPNEGKRITWSGYFTEATAKRTLDSLEHCGWDGVDVATMKGFGSKNVELVLEEEQGQDGKMYPRVQWVNRLVSRGPANVYSQEQVTGLAARLAAINAERKREKGEAESAPDPFGNG